MRPAADRRGPGAAALALSLVLGGLAGPARAADPYAQLEACRTHLSQGRLDDAAATLADLRRTLAETPAWDPDGTFRDTLIPRLAGRLRPLQEAVARLEALYRERWQTMEPPARLLAEGNLRAYVNHLTDALLQIREERDAIVAGVSSLEDRAVLYEIAAHRRIATVLDTGVMQRLNAAADEVVRRLDSEDESMRMLRARLEQLRRSAVDLSSEREQLTAALDEARQRMESYLGALATMVTEGVGVSPDIPLPGREAVDDVFSGLIEQRARALDDRASQTAAERDSRLAAVDRYRHYNGVLSRARVARDRSDSIDRLAARIRAIPVLEERRPAEAAGGGSRLGLALAAMALGAAAGGALLVGRRQRSGKPPGTAS